MMKHLHIICIKTKLTKLGQWFRYLPKRNIKINLKKEQKRGHSNLSRIRCSHCCSPIKSIKRGIYHQSHKISPGVENMSIKNFMIAQYARLIFSLAYNDSIPHDTVISRRVTNYLARALRPKQSFEGKHDKLFLIPQ